MTWVLNRYETCSSGRHGERGGPGKFGRTDRIWGPIGYGKLREGRELKLFPKFCSFIEFSTYSVTREWLDEISWGEKESRRGEADLGDEFRGDHVDCQSPESLQPHWPVVPSETWLVRGGAGPGCRRGVGTTSEGGPGHAQTHNLWSPMEKKNVGPLFK